MSNNTKVIQPEVNIGLVGHVDHGKTTLTERLTGKWTDTHSEEIKRGITIRLGYANASFYECDCFSDPNLRFTSKPECPNCNKKPKFLRKVSFVDAPGHESLMATMLSGATIMDGALLIVAANEPCPQPQTREHLMALQIAGIKQIVVVQNKIDLVTKEQALKNYKEIKEFLNNTEYADAPVIPVSARMKVNIGVLIQAIQEYIKTPKRDSTKPPLMVVARSFDINRPGYTPSQMVGAVLGGSLLQGQLKTGDEVEIVPGIKIESGNAEMWQSIKTKIVGIKSGDEAIEVASPGGSIAIQTTLDPSIVKSDALAGNTVGLVGKVPKVWYELKLRVKLLERVVGTKEDLQVDPIKLNEVLMLNVNSAATVGIPVKLEKDVVFCKLKLPVAANIGNKVTISRRIGSRFRLIGYGIIE